jgi:hypothetical protein
MKKGENEYTYTPYTSSRQRSCGWPCGKSRIYHVDCGSYIANDILPRGADEADSVLRLANCDLKSVGYFFKPAPAAHDSKWDADKQYKVLPTSSHSRLPSISQGVGAVTFKLPYSQELEEQYLAGNLLADYP